MGQADGNSAGASFPQLTHTVRIERDMQKRQTLIVDASYDQETGMTGIGIVIHEAERPRRDGIVIDQIAECYTGIRPGRGEMFAVYRALELGTERGFTVIKIRSDYNSMRTALKQSYEKGKVDGNAEPPRQHNQACPRL